MFKKFHFFALSILLTMSLSVCSAERSAGSARKVSFNETSSSLGNFSSLKRASKSHSMGDSGKTDSASNFFRSSNPSIKRSQESKGTFANQKSENTMQVKLPEFQKSSSFIDKHNKYSILADKEKVRQLKRLDQKNRKRQVSKAMKKKFKNNDLPATFRADLSEVEQSVDELSQGQADGLHLDLPKFDSLAFDSSNSSVGTLSQGQVEDFKQHFQSVTLPKFDPVDTSEYYK